MRQISAPCNALLIGSAATKMWFRHFREAPDYDLYVLPSFVDQFITENPTLIIKNRTDRKMVGRLNNQKIDMTIDATGSWVGHIMKANENSQQIHFHSSKVTLATPTTLRLIKEVLSCWRQNWRKNITDYTFLKGVVKGQYSKEEQLAFDIGMTNFNRFYPDPGVPIALENRLYRVVELEEIVNKADLTTRIGIKDNIVTLLCGELKW